MGAEPAPQLVHRRGKEHRHLALQTIEAMTHEHGCIRRRARRMQLVKGQAYLVQRDAGQQTITQ